MTKPSVIPCPELAIIDRLIFQPTGFNLSTITTDPESKAYSGHQFKLGEQDIIFRVAKITPTKAGQFVTIWKRNEKGITEPFHYSDQFNFFIIVTRTDKNLGTFIFPKEVLREQKIIADNSLEGKRGIRVYPAWDLTTNRQAQKTQGWQTNYFIDLSSNNPVDIEQVRRLLNR